MLRNSTELAVWPRLLGRLGKEREGFFNVSIGVEGNFRRRPRPPLPLPLLPPPAPAALTIFANAAEN